MSELIKYETQSGLTFKQQVTYAQQHSLIKDTDDDLLNNVVNISLGKSVQLTGFKLGEQDYDILLAEMVKELKSNAKGLRISEISIAFDRGIKKVYGEWVGLSVVTFTGFIRAYLKDQERLDILKSLEPERKELPPVKWDGTKRYEELLKEYKEKGSCEDTGNLVYDWLIQEGKIQLGYGKQFYTTAQQQPLKENRVKMLGELNQFNRNAIQKLINEIESKSSNQTIVLAKKLALNAYFKDII